MISQLDEGYLSVVVAAIFFGSQGAVVNAPAVLRTKVHPIVWQTYYSFSVACLCLLVLPFEAFHFSSWGILAGFQWTMTQLLLFLAVHTIGLALSIAIWSGVTILVGFLIGYLGFGNQLTNTALTFVGMFVLIFGIVGTAILPTYLQTRIEQKNQTDYATLSEKESGNLKTSDVPNQHSDITDNVATVVVRVRGERETSQDITKAGGYNVVVNGEHAAYKGRSYDQKRSSTGSFDIPSQISGLTPAEEKTPLSRYLIGIGYAVLFGFINGSLQVPLQEFQNQVGLASNDPKSISYLGTFAIGIFISTPLMAILYFVATRKTQKLHFVAVFPWAFLSGVVWTIGYVGATYSTIFLDQAIGYPLAQCGILIGGVWGIFYFKEIRGVVPISVFFFFGVIILGGAFMMSFYGRDPNS